MKSDPVSNTPLRLKEASKLGFDRALLPASGEKGGDGMKQLHFAKLANLVDHMLARDLIESPCPVSIFLYWF